ncbi:MAG: glycosyltransferase, partial [Tannerella sp.]|nr:glycosyltransferase [Tannerella sp.]
MMLIHDFFSIIHKTGDDNEWVYRLSLNAGHPIYRAHFKGNPITPGACIVQMLKELAETHYSTSFFIAGVKNVKFLVAINPIENKEIDARLSCAKDENGTLSMTAIISNEKVVFCKANLVLKDTGAAKQPALQDRFDQHRFCVVIPTYNNEKTLSQILDDVLKFTHSVIVVN